MNRLTEIKDKFGEGLEQTWDSLREGWRQFQNSAGRALTRFTPSRKNGRRSTDLAGTGDSFIGTASGWSVLAAEVKDYDDKVSVVLEVPGMEIGDFNIEVIGTKLLISGEKHAEREESRGEYHIFETAYGHFERTVLLPAEVDETKATAKYRRGVLKIMLPKLKTAKKQRIEIVSG